MCLHQEVVDLITLKIPMAVVLQFIIKQKQEILML